MTTKTYPELKYEVEGLIDLARDVADAMHDLGAPTDNQLTAIMAIKHLKLLRQELEILTAAQAINT